MADYLGFISYSHADAMDLSEHLDSYLRKHNSKFDTVYDGQVPEGERLERIIEKLKQCDIFILIITTDSLTSDAIAEEIKIAKEKGMKIIPCKDKYLNIAWHDLPWSLPEYKGLEFENKYELRRRVIYALSNIIEEMEQEKEAKERVGKEDKIKFQEKTIATKIVSKDTFPTVEKPRKSEKIVLQSDKSVYLYNSDMICTIINTNKTSTIPMNLVIFNEEKKVVYKNSIPINPDGNVIYQEVIHVGGDEWTSKPGSEYLLSVEHEGNKANLAFYISDFGAAIELDQKVYSWTDKVHITIVAPDLVKDPNKIERIGNDDKSKIIISTRKAKLQNYELIETNPGTGIFVGEIRLTGFSNYDARGDNKMEKTMGITSGKGPTDGLLGCEKDDGIKIVLKTKYDEYSGAALIRWNIGEIQWDKSNYKIADTGTVIVIDPDLNLNPNLIELIPIRIWSDSDPVGIETIAVETGNNTGIFVAGLQFVRKTTKNNLQVTSGDTVTAEYIDRTLPDPYNIGSNLAITTTATIA